mmetsp:Transcript_30977/g.74817  ORF Transcript_30977/g.74817 Transcript_30977/m.74817 type:complete len:435 (-) Transcript_30977:97-1401(-)
MTTTTTTMTARKLLVIICCSCFTFNAVYCDDRLGLPGGGGGDGTNSEQVVGDGVTEFKDIMDNCTGAAGPRPIDFTSSPGRTTNANVDNVNGGFCGVDINTPGIWWMVTGTGETVRASSCHQNTDIKTKISIFKGSCDNLVCVTGTQRSDFECGLGQRRGEAWNTQATAVDFPTELDVTYYILVQQADPEDRGVIWMNYRVPDIPPNNECIDAIGPVPRDMTAVPATTTDAHISDVPVVGYCNDGQTPALYPGVWFQLMGTGGSITIMACGASNYDGFWFSVYRGAYCDSLECVDGEFSMGEDAERCDFGTRARPTTKYTFDTVDRDRYFIYVQFARTQEDLPTGPFRFFADDGKGGAAGSSGPHLITFEESTMIAADGSIIGGEGGQGGINGVGEINANGDIFSPSGSTSWSSSMSLLALLQAAVATLFFLQA